MFWNRKKTKLAENGGVSLREKKKTSTYQTQQEREALMLEVKKLEYLLELAESYPEITEALKQVIDKLKFSSPSNDDKVLSFDKKIFNKIDDLKLILAKNKINVDEILELIRDIKQLIGERNSIIL